MTKEKYLVCLAVFSLHILVVAEKTEQPAVGMKILGDEPALHIVRYGVDETTVVSNGFLFVQGAYIARPYHIRRIGQAVVVNGILVNELFKGDPDESARTNTAWTASSYGFRADTPKELALIQKTLLIRDLESGGVVFISHNPSSPAREMKIPVTAKWHQNDLRRVIDIASSESPEPEIIAVMKSLELANLRTDQDVKAFCDYIRASPQLLNQIITDEKEGNPSPSSIKTSPPQTW